MSIEIKKLAKALRTEWMILELVVEAEIKAGSSDAYDVQLDRFEEAFRTLERALEAA